MVTATAPALTQLLPAAGGTSDIQTSQAQGGEARGSGAEFRQAAAEAQTAQSTQAAQSAPAAAARSTATAAAAEQQSAAALPAAQTQSTAAGERSGEARIRHFGANSRRHRAEGDDSERRSNHPALDSMRNNFEASLEAIRVEGISSFMERRSQGSDESSQQQTKSTAAAAYSAVADYEPFDPSRYTPTRQLSSYDQQNLKTMHAEGRTPTAGVIARRYGGCAFNTIVGHYLNIRI